MILITTSKGVIHVRLDEENTPITTKNFLDYIRAGFYNNTIFHRVIDDFMIQGGGFLKDMLQKVAQAPIENEAKTSKPNKRGTLAMARTMDPHSASSQFFINVADNMFLNFNNEQPQGYGYCVFGEVTAGMDVVDAIAKVKTGQSAGHGDVPIEPIIIDSICEV